VDGPDCRTIPTTYLARHGVDHDLFAGAMDDRTELPPDLAAIPHPRLGFYGTIQDWIDFRPDLPSRQRRPDWSIVLIGKTFVDVSRLLQFPNIHLLGRRDHDQLPNYCKGFDVGIIPYVVNERILHVNPIKLREYLSAGLPVVSTAFPEVKLYPSFARRWKLTSNSRPPWKRPCEPTTPRCAADAATPMAEETWEKKVALVGQRRHGGGGGENPVILGTLFILCGWVVVYSYGIYAP